MKRILAFPRLEGCQLTSDEEERLFRYLLNDQAHLHLIVLVILLADLQRGVISLNSCNANVRPASAA